MGKKAKLGHGLIDWENRQELRKKQTPGNKVANFELDSKYNGGCEKVTYVFTDGNSEDERKC